MEPKADIYIPACFRSFQGFQVKDIKEFRSSHHMELILEATNAREHLCNRCGEVLGAQDGRYWLTCRHMRVMSWTVAVSFWREKRHCPNCQKVRSPHRQPRFKENLYPIVLVWKHDDSQKN